MLKTLLGSVREYKKNAFLTPLFVAFEVVLEVLIPLITANLIDFGIDAGDMNYVLKSGALLLISALVSLLMGALAGRHAAIASNGFAMNLRHDMYYNVQKFSFSNIDKFSTASIVTRLTTDVTNVQQSFQMITRMAVRSPMMMIFSLVAAFRIDAKLSLIFLAAIPVLGVGVFLLMSKVRPVFERVFKTYDRLNSVVQENVRGIRVVKSFVREDYESDKFRDISGKIYKDFTKAEKTIALNMPLMQFCMYTCTLLISWFGARAIVACGGDPDAGLSTGELMSLMSYAIQILSSLMMVSFAFVMITLSRASAGRITEVLNEKSDITNPASPVTEVRNGDIEFDHVSFGYSKSSEKLCLNNISLKIASGETIGVIGVTGSSKTTLVSLIPRLYDVTEGSVRVGGVDVREYDIEALRNAVSVVLQKNELFSGTIKDNLRWGNENATDEEMKAACVAACADGFISELPSGYDTYIEQGGTNVSGGQKQRLCIARALLKKPAILILDDSTSAVDTKTDAMIRSSFSKMIPGTTKIIIAQRVASVMHADRIIMMDNGEIEDVGSHEELMKKSAAYRGVYESQMKGSEEA